MACRMVGYDLVIGQPVFILPIGLTPIHHAPRKSGYSAMNRHSSRHQGPITSFSQCMGRNRIDHAETTTLPQPLEGQADSL
jgi:hypothetical protein